MTTLPEGLLGILCKYEQHRFTNWSQRESGQSDTWKSQWFWTLQSAFFWQLCFCGSYRRCLKSQIWSKDVIAAISYWQWSLNLNLLSFRLCQLAELICLICCTYGFSNLPASCAGPLLVENRFLAKIQILNSSSIPCHPFSSCTVALCSSWSALIGPKSQADWHCSLWCPLRIKRQGLAGNG